jgi:hypothetical protein
LTKSRKKQRGMVDIGFLSNIHLSLSVSPPRFVRVIWDPTFLLKPQHQNSDLTNKINRELPNIVIYNIRLGEIINKTGAEISKIKNLSNINKQQSKIK